MRLGRRARGARRSWGSSGAASTAPSFGLRKTQPAPPSGMQRPSPAPHPRADRGPPLHHALRTLQLRLHPVSDSNREGQVHFSFNPPPLTWTPPARAPSIPPPHLPPTRPSVRGQKPPAPTTGRAQHARRGGGRTHGVGGRGRVARSPPALGACVIFHPSPAPPRHGPVPAHHPRGPRGPSRSDSRRHKPALSRVRAGLPGGPVHRRERS